MRKFANIYLTEDFDFRIQILTTQKEKGKSWFLKCAKDMNKLHKGRHENCQ